MKAWQTPMLTSPSANSAGSQTTRFIDLSFLPAQPLRPCGSSRQIASRTFAPLAMPSFAASLRLEASAYIWARKDKRDPDKGSIPIAMRAYKAAIKALSATGAEGLVGGVLPGACGSVRD